MFSFVELIMDPGSQLRVKELVCILFVPLSVFCHVIVFCKEKNIFLCLKLNPGFTS